MSHFAVLVVTKTNEREELDAALAPYHEFECTGVDDQYVKTLDITETTRANWEESEDYNGSFHDYCLDYCGLKALPAGEEPDLTDRHKYGWAEVDAVGEVVKVIDRTNPDRKWDWWVVGGRWKKLLLGRDGRFYDRLQLAQIDIPAMRGKAVEEARRQWQAFAEIVAGRELPAPWKTYREGFSSIDEARKSYNAIPVVKDLLEPSTLERMGVGFFDDPIERFAMGGKAAFVEQQKRMAFSTFAVLKDGVWSEQGEMGYWGIVLDGRPAGDWQDEFDRLLATVDPAHWLTVVDCHI